MRYRDIFQEDASSSPEFKRWFAGSKVVDEHGQPLRMYHGTSHNNISRFEVGYNSAGNKQWTGNHKVVSFTADPSFADGYAGSTVDSLPDRRPTIYPVYIRAINPADFRNPEHVKLAKKYYIAIKQKWIDGVIISHPHVWTPDTVAQDMARENQYLDLNLSHGTWTRWENPALWQAFGWDGAWSREEPNHHNGRILNFAIADGRQAKAAYGNKTFDPDDPTLTGRQRPLT